MATRETRARRGARIVVGLALAAAIGASALMGARPGRAAQDVGTPTPTPVPGTGPATVSVGGHGVVRIEPDTASFTAGVTVTQESLATAQAEANRTMGLIIEAVKDAGVAEDDIQTVNFSVNILYRYDPNGNPEGIEGYQVSNQVTVKVRNLEQLGELLDTVVAQGANTIYGISFFVDDPSAAASQARAMAVEDAREKAEEMAAAAGVRLGRLVSMTESAAPPPAPQEFAEAAARDAAAAPSVPIQVGSTEVTVDVSVTWELEQ